MISDGKNIMISNKESLQLLLMLRYFDNNCIEYFHAENEDEMIVRDWIQRWQAALLKTKETPFGDITI